MSNWKAKYFIVYPHKSFDDLKWECTTHYACRAHVPNMLQEILNVSTVGGEIKLIWNHHHEREMIERFNITYEELDDYIKSDCSMISFSSKRTRKRALKELKRLGAKEMCTADGYKDMMLIQAHYRKNRSLPKV